MVRSSRTFNLSNNNVRQRVSKAKKEGLRKKRHEDALNYFTKKIPCDSIKFDLVDKLVNGDESIKNSSYIFDNKSFEIKNEDVFNYFIFRKKPFDYAFFDGSEIREI